MNSGNRELTSCIGFGQPPQPALLHVVTGIPAPHKHWLCCPLAPPWGPLLTFCTQCLTQQRERLWHIAQGSRSQAWIGCTRGPSTGGRAGLRSHLHHHCGETGKRRRAPAHSFPTAAVTSDHTYGLDNANVLPDRLEVRYGFTGLQSRCLFPCLFQPLDDAHILWLAVPFLHLKSKPHCISFKC